jgi:hypothetical protein
MSVPNQMIGGPASHCLEVQMIRKRGRTPLLFLIALIFVSLQSLILANRTHAENHFWNDLGIVKIDEKLTAPSFRLKDLNGKEVKLEDHRGGKALHRI